MDKKTGYLCDPKINTECKKTGCYINGGMCEYTTDKRFAAKNEKGVVIAADFKPVDETEQAWRAGYLHGLASAAKKRKETKKAAQKIKIVGKMPSLNEYIEACRRNAHCGARLKANVEAGIIPQLAKLKKIEKPVHIIFIWHEVNKRRDKDNVAAAKKFILDALQKSGKLINDNNNYIIGFTDKFDYTATENAVTLIIESGENDVFD